MLKGVFLSYFESSQPSRITEGGAYYVRGLLIPVHSLEADPIALLI